MVDCLRCLESCFGGVLAIATLTIMVPEVFFLQSWLLKLRHISRMVPRLSLSQQDSLGLPSSPPLKR